MTHRAPAIVPFVALLLVSASPAVSASSDADVLERGVQRAGRGIYLGESRAVRDLPEVTGASSGARAAQVRAVPERRVLPDRIGGEAPATAPRAATDPGSRAASGQGSRAAVAPKASFTGQDGFEGIMNADHPGDLRVPPDTVGDIGFGDHYVQMTNTLFEIFDRDGMNLDGPHLISDLWSGFGGVCENQNQGDPIVVHDQFADRWLLSQFNFVRSGGAPSGPFWECIALSTSSDPTGTYHLYAFMLHPTLMPDYPKIGVWHDGYYMTSNQFDHSPGGNGDWAGGAVTVFERDAMLDGASAKYIHFDLNNLAFGGMLPADIDGPVLPPVDAPAYFAQFDLPSAFNDSQVRFFGAYTDWSGAGSMVLTNPEGTVDLTSRGFSIDTSLCPVVNGEVLLDCIPQKDTNVKVDALADRLMWRLVYRNFGSHESLLVNHTVDVGGNQAGVRWYEFRDPSNPVLHQGGTYAPGSRHRWMGSIAMDGDGNIALGYSRSGENSFPGIFATGRAASDAPGTMSVPERTLKLGNASQTFSKNRWGDYSSMNVDPTDDCTFWYTNQFYETASEGENGEWRTWVSNFKIDGCDGLATGSLSGTVTGAPPGGAIVQAGTLRTRTGPGGAYSFPAIPAGRYRVVASAPLKGPAETTRTITGGGAATADLTLGAPQPQGADFNGDGYGDLAVGVPLDRRDGKESGAVNVFHGGPGGLTKAPTAILHQESPGVSGSGEHGDNFGVSLATGNFDGDAYDDLAVGVWGEGLFGRPNAGLVHIFPGSADGLDPTTSQTFHQGSPGVRGRVERGDQFGWALAAGDFDGDGRDDLGIGVPGENRNRGGVAVLYGGANGLTARDQFWTQNSRGIAGVAEVGDRFGEALAAGDFGRSGKDDLAIGVPHEGFGSKRRVGAVHVLFGATGAGGLRAANDRFIHQGAPGIAGTNEVRDRYGAALAAGNFNGDARDDLAIGIPGETVGRRAEAGAFAVLKGSGTGPSASGDRWLHRNVKGVAGVAFGTDGFGERLTTGDLNGDGRDDLIVGAPLDHVIGRPDAGTFNAFSGHASAIITTAGDRVWSQMEIGQSASEELDLLAVGLGAGDFDGDGLADLAVGVPGESTPFTAGLGVVNTLFGSSRGLTSMRGQLLSQIGSVPNVERQGELFGWAAAG